MLKARGQRRLDFDLLEGRLLLASVQPLSSLVWIPVGPNPIGPSTEPLPPVPGESGDDFGGLGPDPIDVNFPAAGRLTGIAPSPTDPNTVYVAAAGGGVWKTTDGGTNWTPLTDNQATLDMGSIALAPSNPNIIYAGTGEASTPYFDSFPGHGILKSTNAGASWTLLGRYDAQGNPLFDRRSIPKIVVDPNNPDIVYAAVADYATGAAAGNTGIWKSTDGGVTWSDTTDSSTAHIAPGDSFVDLVMDPTNSQVLYAAAGHPSGNASNGVYKTTDGGLHWQATGALSTGGSTGRIGLAVAPGNSQILYAVIGDVTTGLMSIDQTTDGGSHWVALPGIPQTIDVASSQAFYDLTIAVDPTDPTGNTFYTAGQAGANSILRVVVTPGNPPTTTVEDISGGTNSPHADHHAIAFDAMNRLLDGNDGGLWRLDSYTPAVNWSDLNGNLGITEFVGIAVDPTSAAIAYGGSQDNGTEQYTGLPAWTAIAGGDGGFVRIDQSNNQTVYHEYYGISLQRSDNGGATWNDISPPGATGGLFYVPYVMDPSNSQRLLYGTATLYETTNKGNNWAAIGTPGTQGFNPFGSAITAIAVAKSSPNTVYATTGDQVFRTGNDGASWTDVSIPGVGGIDDLQVDPFNAARAFAVVGQYGGGKIYMTTDSGAHWSDISGNLPDQPARSLVIDPRTSPETLYLAVDDGVYASFDTGAVWVRFGSGLPNVMAKQLELQLNGGVNILAAGTYGRGLFEMQSNDPLVVTAMVPGNPMEGRPFTNVDVATFTDPTAGAHPVSNYSATIDWGDGTPDTAGTILVDANGVFHVSGSHTYDEEGPYMVTVVASSTTGSSGGATTPSFNVTDAPLTATGATLTGREGIALKPGTLLATFADSDPLATLTDYTLVTVDWGDGSPLTVLPAANLSASGSVGGMTFNVTGTHTYAEEGTYQVTVRINDAGGSQTTAHAEADIADAPLLSSPPQPVVSGTEGVPLTAAPVAAFLDANPSGPLGDFVATIDWGDGTPQSAGALSQPGGAGTPFVVSGTHTYVDSGVNGGVGHFPITVHVVDAGGSSLTLTNTASVADVPIVLTGFLNPATDSGRSHFDAITNIAEPNFFGTSEPFSHVSLYATPTGGGTAVLIGQTQAGGDGFWSITTNHLNDGSYTITGAATDRSGKTTTGSTTPATPVAFLPNANQGPLVVDTVGPRVADVTFNRLSGQVDVTFQDERSGLNEATLLDSANYQLTKPHTNPGAFLLTNINVTPPAGPTDPEAVGLVFNSGHVLHGASYTFTIRDSSRGASTIQDVAGNSLDGEFYGAFPSGNGIPGGDFVAMLTAYHNKIFAPQPLAGTANAANGGQGGAPVGAPHSGVFTTTDPPRHKVVIGRHRIPTPTVVTSSIHRRVPKFHGK